MPQELRRTFNEDADLYARVRPGYPADLFTDLANLTGIGPGSRILEIGPGTGQATLELADLGADITAIELGPELAAVLQHRLESHHHDTHHQETHSPETRHPETHGPETHSPETHSPSSVQIEVGAFEDWPLPQEPFDVVASFTAWHWLDPAVRSAKAAAALRPGGSLVTVTTEHVRGGTTDFFDQAQDCYRRWDPATPPGLLLLDADAVPADHDEVDESAAFHPAIRRRYRQDLSYSTTAYLDLLNTYSGHRALPAERRAGLLTDLGNLIDQHYGGTVTKSYRYELRVAQTRW